MNIAEASIRNKTVTLVFAALMVVLGIWSYLNLPRLEDPEFTIKDALIITPYPGASAEEVEKEVSDVIELAAQQLGQLDKVVSRSERGRSTVTVSIRDQYDSESLPQVWDELRRKVNDARRHLPPGAGPSLVLDDFGDVFGIFFALTGPEFSDAKLYEIAKLLRRELLLVPDVQKVEIFGRQQEIIFIELSRDRIAQLGIHPNEIFALLKEQNLVVQSGAADVGSMGITINPTGEWTGVEDFENLLIRGGGGSELIYLKDIATVRRDTIDPPTTSLRFDGQRAIGIGISTVAGGNVVTMGEAVQERIRQLGSQIPLGMKLETISFQGDTVTQAINEFIANLVTSVIIVVVVLLVAMGVRSGLIIGAILLITMCGTMLVMEQAGLILERISLGALIISLVMLVDNAIVIVEGILMGMQKGHDKLKAAKNVVSQTAIPLLGSTAIAVLAFGAIGLSDDSTGEYCRSLFVVLLISLGLSWITAVTITPLFGFLFLKSESAEDAKKPRKDPYGGAIYQIYKKILVACMRARTATILVLVGLMALAIYGFGFLQNSFFPDSTRPQFMVDVWLPVGTRLDETDRITGAMQNSIKDIPGINHITTSVGQGALRFLLTYSPERADTAYAQFLIDVEDHALISKILPQVQQKLTAENPDALIIAKRFLLGPGEGGRIQIRFSGEDTDTLRGLAGQAMDILRVDGGAKGIRIDSREPVPVLRPQFSEAQARLTGITRTDLGNTLEAAFSGRTIGVYRERDEILPIVARGPEAERMDPDMIRDVQIFSPVAGRFIPVRQIVSGFTTELEDPLIMRRNRLPTITVHADQTSGLASTLFERVRTQVEAIPMPPGYAMAWGGEHEDSSQAKAALAGTLPAFLLMMVVIVICLFNSLKVTLIIWLTVPLSIIGIVVGLLVFDQPFGFMALLGALSLSGMLIKNGIVLVDEINVQMASGAEPWNAVVDAAVSRVRPVSMAVLTTVFGLIPLITDVFFGAMAVTIVVGLSFASALTLLVVPVLYVTFFRIKAP